LSLSRINSGIKLLSIVLGLTLQRIWDSSSSVQYFSVHTHLCEIQSSTLRQHTTDMSVVITGTRLVKFQTFFYPFRYISHKRTCGPDLP